MGGGESLVHVQVHDVKAHVAGPHAADAVHGLGDLDDVLLEQAEGARVGEHDAGDVVV